MSHLLVSLQWFVYSYPLSIFLLGYLLDLLLSHIVNTDSLSEMCLPNRHLSDTFACLRSFTVTSICFGFLLWLFIFLLHRTFIIIWISVFFFFYSVWISCLFKSAPKAKILKIKLGNKITWHYVWLGTWNTVDTQQMFLLSLLLLLLCPSPCSSARRVKVPKVEF